MELTDIQALAAWEAGDSETIAASMMDLAHFIAWSYKRSGTSLEEEDLAAEALLGLTEALPEYDPARGVPLKSYLAQRMRWTAARAIQSSARERSLGPDSPRGQASHVRLTFPHGEKQAGIYVAQNTGTGNESFENPYLPREEPTDFDGPWLLLNGAMRAGAITEEDAQLVSLRVLEGWTFTELGDMLGVSRQRAHQRHDLAREALREHVECGATC